MNIILQKLFGAAVRHGLTAAGGYLVARGIVPAETVDAVKTGVENAGVDLVQVGTGVLVGAAGYAWSAFNKWFGR